MTVSEDAPIFVASPLNATLMLAVPAAVPAAAVIVKLSELTCPCATSTVVGENVIPENFDGSAISSASVVYNDQLAVNFSDLSSSQNFVGILVGDVDIT